MTSKKLFEVLGGIDPAYVAEADITGRTPVTAAGKKAKKEKGESAFGRFMSSPVAAAVLSGIVAFGVVFFIVRAGREAGRQPVGPEASSGQTQNELFKETDAPTDVEMTFEGFPSVPPTELPTEPIMPPEVDLLDLDPSYASRKQTQVRILVESACAADVRAVPGAVSPILTEAMVERDTALRQVWGCDPAYHLCGDFRGEVNRFVLAGEDEYDLCMSLLDTALLYSTNGYEMDLTDLRLGLDTDIWDQGITALTLNGHNVYAAPAVDVVTNDNTYAVFYNAYADGGLLQSEIDQLGFAWTFEQMAEMMTRAEGTDPDGDGTAVQGMCWGDRGFSALLLGSGLRASDVWYQGTFTCWLTDKKDLVLGTLQPMIDSFTSGKADILPYSMDWPFADGASDAGRYVFCVGPLSWLYDRDERSLNKQLTVLPLPQPAANMARDSLRNYTSAFGGACLFIPTTAYRDVKTVSAPILYVYADVTSKTLKQPYLDQLVPASDTVSRQNVERLLMSRTYDVVLNGAVNVTLPANPNALITQGKIIHKELDKVVKKWASLYE